MLSSTSHMACELLPALLQVSLEKTGSQLDNLLRAEKMGWISSAESWIEIRTLRNKLVHEYKSGCKALSRLVVNFRCFVSFSVSSIS
jgi:hypothetical protein